MGEGQRPAQPPADGRSVGFADPQPHRSITLEVRPSAQPGRRGDLGIRWRSPVPLGCDPPTPARLLAAPQRRREQSRLSQPARLLLLTARFLHYSKGKSYSAFKA